MVSHAEYCDAASQLLHLGPGKQTRFCFSLLRFSHSSD